MPSGQPDASPSTGGSEKSVGLKNDDGRQKGKLENPEFSDKAVHDMPNEGAPSIKAATAPGELI